MEKGNRMSHTLVLGRSNRSFALGLARIGLVAGSTVLALGLAGCGDSGTVFETATDGDGGTAGSDGGTAGTGGGSAGTAGSDGGTGGSDGGTGGTAGTAGTAGDGGTGGGEEPCGNGTLDDGELCDTSIAAGEEGACPTSCDDGEACTTDSLTGTECTQACAHGDISIDADDDGCCLASGNANTDNDCFAECGNGVAESGEACDTAIAAGDAGACPTACDDGDVCTADAVANPGTCDAICEAPAITDPANGDGCCPGGANIGNDDDCSVACGDGVWGNGVTAAGEACDTAIAAGEAGACPTACDDGNSCSSDRLDNAGTCDAICGADAITAPANGDGCCPDGANITTDDDCTASCGDGAKTGSENCDTAIAPGDAGSCPTSCNDNISCTADSLVNGGTCNAACAFDPITAPANGDSCCPAGANIGNDNDCPVRCNDGVVSNGESCDTAIASGPGSCPTSCDDGDVCTRDTLVNGGTCAARCNHPDKTPNLNAADQCCPNGANLSSDIDCAPACNDRVITPPETCDDGNNNDGDGCSATCVAEPTAFRFDNLTIKDPHLRAFGGGTCIIDITNTANGMINDAVTADDPDAPDGLLDLSMVHVFMPHYQAAGTTTPGFLAMPDCTAPMDASTACTLPPGGNKTVFSSVNHGSGFACLGIRAGTTDHGGITVPTAPGGGTCYVGDVGQLTLALGGINIALEDTTIAGEWVGLPATRIEDGLVVGFLSKAVADATDLPDDFPIGAGGPISALLCNREMDKNGGADGWWFYLNFTAAKVDYSEL